MSIPTTHQHKSSTGLILLAAGRSQRFGKSKSEVYLHGKPILQYSIDAFSAISSITHLAIIVRDETQQNNLTSSLNIPPHLHTLWVKGGDSRQTSTLNGLLALQKLKLHTVIIHDGARPCIQTQSIIDLMEAITPQNGAILAAPVCDTLKKVNPTNHILNTLSRDDLWAAQTPQAFPFDAILQAHLNCHEAATDDAAVASAHQLPVVIVHAKHPNPKLTYPEDLPYIEWILHPPSATVPLLLSMRIGHGYDIHTLVPHRKLILGGVQLDYPLGLEGHSDADVLIHALADAILGSLGLPDIGHFFPNTDPNLKDMDSQYILLEALSQAHQQGYGIHNVDITVIAEAPKIKPYIEPIKTNLSHILGIEPQQIGLKATTHEGHDAVGQNQAIAVHAICLLGKIPTQA